MPSKPAPDKFLNFKEVAELIGLDWTTVRDGKCGTNEIPRIKLSNKCVRFSFNAVQAWMALKAEEAQADQQREHSTVIDLFAQGRHRRRFVKDTARQLANEERRRWER